MSVDEAQRQAAEEDRLLNVIRLTEQERHSVFRAIVEKCEVYQVLVTAMIWLVVWAILMNFYPTTLLLTILQELIERTP